MFELVLKTIVDKGDMAYRGDRGNIGYRRDRKDMGDRGDMGYSGDTEVIIYLHYNVHICRSSISRDVLTTL